MLPSQPAVRAYIYAAILLLSLTALLIFFSPGLAAQSLRVGTEFGSDFTAPTSGENVSFTGWNAAATANLELIGPIGIEASLRYSSRTGRTDVGAGLVGLPDFVGDADKFFSESRSEFLSLPVSLRIDFGGSGAAPFVYAGTTLGVLFDAADLDAMPQEEQPRFGKRASGDAASAAFARADFGAGIRMPAGRGFDVELEARTSWDVPGIGGVSASDSWTMTSMQCVVGLNYRLF